MTEHPGGGSGLNFFEMPCNSTKSQAFIVRKRHSSRFSSTVGTIGRAFPRRASIPSFPIIGTMTSPATGLVHHQPDAALIPRPISRIADKYPQMLDWRESAWRAPLLGLDATFRLARGTDSQGNSARFRWFSFRNSGVEFCYCLSV